MQLWLCAALALQPLLHARNASLGAAPAPARALLHTARRDAASASGIWGLRGLYSKYRYGEAAGAQGPPGELLVMVSHGCSGSTWVRKQTLELLAALGRPGIYNFGEGTKPGNNPFLEHNALGTATRQVIAALGREGRPGLVKALPQDGFNQGFLKALKQGNSKVVVMDRANELDSLLCEARDCFTNAEGLIEQVDAHGWPTRCESRRFAGGERKGAGAEPDREGIAASAEMLHVSDASALVDFLARARAKSEEVGARFAAAGLAPARVTFERLTAFEYSREAADLEASVDEWTKVVSAYGVADSPATRATVEAVLRPAAGTFEPRRHKDVLTNFKFVKAAFARASPEVGAMLH